MAEAEITEAELTNLQNQSVAALGAATSSPKYVLPELAAGLLMAIPALCDEIRHARDRVAFLEAQLAAVRRLVDETLDPDDPPRPLTDADDPDDWVLVDQSPERDTGATGPTTVPALFTGDEYTRHSHRHPAGGRERHAHTGSAEHAHPDRQLGPAYDHDVY